MKIKYLAIAAAVAFLTGVGAGPGFAQQTNNQPAATAPASSPPANTALLLRVATTMRRLRMHRPRPTHLLRQRLKRACAGRYTSVFRRQCRWPEQSLRSVCLREERRLRHQDGGCDPRDHVGRHLVHLLHEVLGAVPRAQPVPHGRAPLLEFGQSQRRHRQAAEEQPVPQRRRKRCARLVGRRARACQSQRLDRHVAQPPTRRGEFAVCRAVSPSSPRWVRRRRSSVCSVRCGAF